MIPIFNELSNASGLGSKLIRERINSVWHLIQKDRITVDDFWKYVGKIINVDQKKIKKVWIKGAVKAKPYKAVENFAKSLKKKGYLIVLLSNSDKSHANIHMRRKDYSFFDKVYLSCEIGLRKPEKELFQKVLTDLKISPAEVVFIDNHKVNVESACEIGIKSLEFKSLTQLKKDLEKLL